MFVNKLQPVFLPFCSMPNFAYVHFTKTNELHCAAVLQLQCSWLIDHKARRTCNADTRWRFKSKMTSTPLAACVATLFPWKPGKWIKVFKVSESEARAQGCDQLDGCLHLDASVSWVLYTTGSCRIGMNTHGLWRKPKNCTHGP